MKNIVFTPRDWQDNIEEEDGFVCLICSKCNLEFRGWKLKKICRVCSIPEFPMDIRHITHVAIVYDGVIFCLPAPDRHHHVLRLIYAEKQKCSPNTQGFLDSEGIYLTRKEALEVALIANQVLDVNSIRAEQLFSEDLW